MKILYILRHCIATGQEKTAQLTIKGYKQAEELADFFCKKKIDRIISSPFTRAIESITPTAKTKSIQVELDERLAEREIGPENELSDDEKVKLSFMNMDLKWDNGESNNEAMLRISGLIDELKSDSKENILIVTHGNLMALIIKIFNPQAGYIEFTKLTKPDIYVFENRENSNTFFRIIIDIK